VLAFITGNAGVTGSTLLEHFGSPPHGVPPDVLEATVVGLLRGRRVRIELEAHELTSVFDEGARELLKETGLRKARLFPNTPEVLQPKDRNAICNLFRDALGRTSPATTKPSPGAARQGAGKAMSRLDELLEKIVGKPALEVSLQLGGRLITTTAELDGLLEDIKQQINHRLEANHRVRLR
jgi:hypothetical protein